MDPFRKLLCHIFGYWEDESLRPLRASEAEMQREVLGALATLTPQEQQVIKLRLGFDDERGLASPKSISGITT